MSELIDIARATIERLSIEFSDPIPRLGTVWNQDEFADVNVTVTNGTEFPVRNLVARLSADGAQIDNKVWYEGILFDIDFPPGQSPYVRTKDRVDRLSTWTFTVAVLATTPGRASLKVELEGEPVLIWGTTKGQAGGWETPPT